jgi:hypothetical protein
MRKYHRKISIDYRKYFIKYSDGTTTLIKKEDAQKKIIESNGEVSISGITGPGLNMVIFLDQKIKDLGIYEDTKN